MGMNKIAAAPLLSIVIPTRNRSVYAASALRAILRMASGDFELIVQDNSDDQELASQLAEFHGDARLRYARNPQRTSAVENFNDALAKARGQYVTMLGDDDGINPELLQATAWARSQELDSLISSRPAQYWWPDVRFRCYGDQAAGTLDLTEFSGRLSYPDAAEQLQRVVCDAAWNLGELPRTYYGIVRRECLDQLRADAGAYCRVSPDMSMAVGLANYVRRMANLDYPLFLPGSSAKSTAGLGAMGRHVGRLEDQPHLPEACLREWSDVVPRLFSGNSIWAEACVQTLQATGREDMLREFNVALLHARCLAFHPDWSRLVLRSYHRALQVTGQSWAWGTARLISGYCGTWWRRARSLAANLTKSSRLSNTRTFSDLADIEAAGEKLQSLLHDEGWSLAAVLAGVSPRQNSATLRKASSAKHPDIDSVAGCRY